MAKKKKKTLIINREWCKGCGICVALCPQDALILDEDETSRLEHPDKCTLCRACELHCPDLAIELGEAE